MGRLVVIVVGCRDLRAADIGGKSDPFVKLTLGDVTHQTSIMKDTLTPKFDETFTFDNATMDAAMQINVYDKDLITEELLGTAELFCDTLVKGQSVSVWLPLRGTNKGVVGLRLHAIDFGVDPSRVGGGGGGVVVRAGGVSRDALAPELQSEFSMDLITRLADMMRRNDIDGNAMFTKEEFSQFLQELFFVTGTPIPTDDALSQDVNNLFSKYDKDRNALLDVKEFCKLLKESKLKTCLKAKWKSPAAQQQLTASARDRHGVFPPGKTWTGSNTLPSAGTYPGYRLPNGSFVERTKYNPPLPGIIALNTPPAPQAVVEKKILKGMEQLADVELRYCHVESCVISRGKAAGGTFESCTLEGMDLTNVKTLRSCYVKNCTLFNVHPADTHFEGCVLKGGIMYNCSVSDCEVRDMTGFASHFERSRMRNFSDEGNNVLEGTS